MGPRISKSLLAMASGALATLAFAPFSLWWLAPVSLALWMALTLRWPSFWTGFWYGFGLFITGVSWVSVSMIDHGGASLGLAWLMTGTFAAGLAIFPGLASLGYAAWHRRWPGPFRQSMLLVACWVTAEALRSWVLTGFPWLILGYVALDSPFEGYLSWVGSFGVSALLATVAGASLSALLGRSWKPLILAAAILLGGPLLDRIHQLPASGKAVSVALWQPVIRQADKWRPDARDQIVANHLRQGLPLSASLIVWPETALPMSDQEVLRLLPDLEALLIRDGQSLITGVLGEEEGRYTNRLITLGEGQGIYDKTRLVPFGEYVPLEQWLRGLISFFDLPMSAIVPGTRQDQLTHGPLTMAPLICYEIAYTGLARKLARGSNAILTVSNDTWFGDSIGPDQHLEIARIRARELAKPVIRATNDGWTALIDARGQVTDRLPRFEPGLLMGSVIPGSMATPYSHAGEVPLILWLVVVLTLTRKNQAHSLD